MDKCRDEHRYYAVGKPRVILRNGKNYAQYILNNNIRYFFLEQANSDIEFAFFVSCA